MTSRRTRAIVIGAALVAVAAAASARADDRKNLSIRSVVSDELRTTLFIDGANFCAAPLVTLDGVALTVSPASNTSITAVMPALATPGTYRMTVMCRPERASDPVRSDWIDVTLGANGAKGEKGDKGDTGEKGDPGQAGPEGPAGAAGSQGPAGADGLKGETGPAGATGAAGPVGPQGPAGANGAAGATGPAGPAGPAGAQGAVGIPGSSGPMGPQGPAGPAGPAGPVLSSIEALKGVACTRPDGKPGALAVSIDLNTGDVQLRCQIVVTVTDATLTIAVNGNQFGNVIVPTGLPAPSCNGSVCDYHVPFGVAVSLTAVETTGKFTGWSGACSGSDPVCNVTMPGSPGTVSVGATFASLSSLTISPTSASIEFGATQTFVVTNTGTVASPPLSTSVGSPFQITSNTCAGAVLAGGASCTVQVANQAGQICDDDGCWWYPTYAWFEVGDVSVTLLAP